jgi:exonuclease III
MNCVSVCTINVNGIRNKFRRKSLFKILKQKKYDIICLQETFILDKDKDLWEKEWGGQLYCSSVSSHSKGQVTLISKHFSHQTQLTHSSD